LFLVVVYKLTSMDRQQGGPSKNKISIA